MRKDDPNYLVPLLDELRQLRGDLARPRPDTRAWTPDDSCTFFQISANGAFSQGETILAFTVPRNCRAVIAQVSTLAFIPGANSTKDQVNLRIRMGSSGELNGISIHGALMEVVESGAVAGPNVAGMALPADGLSTPARIVLEPGPYQLFNGGTFTLADGSYVGLFGWTFPAPVH